MTEDPLQTYKDAVWDFLLEHCDVMPGGSLFIKFHMSGRADFEKRVRARWKYNYHREDVRAKEHKHEELIDERLMTKKEKRAKWKATQAERRAAIAAVAEENRRMVRKQRILQLTGVTTLRKLWETIHKKR